MYLIIETSPGVSKYEVENLLSPYKKIQRNGQKVNVLNKKFSSIEEVDYRDVEILEAMKKYLSAVERRLDSLEDDVRNKEDRRDKGYW